MTKEVPVDLNSFRTFAFYGGLRLSTNTLQNYQLLRALYLGPPKKILETQQISLRKILAYSKNHVAYYRKLSVGALNNTNPATILHFPTISKDDLQRHDVELRGSMPQGRVQYNRSGGSTGHPIAVYQDRNYRDWERALKMLYYEWAGYRIGEPQAILWGAERDLFRGKATPVRRLTRWIQNQVWLNAFNMDSESMKRYIDILNRNDFSLLLAYSQSAYELCRFLKKEGLKIRSPSSIMTSAGPLFPYMREEIESVLNAPVFDRYGSRELGGVASQCAEREGLHISPLTHYVEILSEEGEPTKPGEIGELVVTSLTNYAMPLIRYRTGDMAAWLSDQCACGSSWPKIDRVRGRRMESFVHPNGGIVDPVYLIHLVGVVLNDGTIKKFQFVQDSLRSIRVRLVLNNFIGLSEQKRFEKEIKQKVNLVMGNGCEVTFEYMDEIEPSPSGKFFYSLTKVRSR